MVGTYRKGGKLRAAWWLFEWMLAVPTAAGFALLAIGIAVINAIW